MKKVLLVIAALAIVGSAFAGRRARECGRVCDREICHEQPKPRCFVPCVVYKEVCPIKNVTYYCPDTCLTDATIGGHHEMIKTVHAGKNIQVEVQEVAAASDEVIVA